MSKRLSTQQLAERAQRQAAARAKLDSGEQLTVDDVTDLQPAEVLTAMNNGLLRDLGYGTKRGRR